MQVVNILCKEKKDENMYKSVRRRDRDRLFKSHFFIGVSLSQAVNNHFHFVLLFFSVCLFFYVRVIILFCETKQKFVKKTDAESKP